MMDIGRFSLRPLGEQDLETVLCWRNSPAVREGMYSDQSITREEHLRWYTRVADSDRYDYSVFTAAGRPLGLVYFTDIDRANGTCFWGFYLGERDRPPHSGMILGLLSLDRAFGPLALRKICGECFATNAASVRFHERLGFRREGCFAKHFFRRGNYFDIVRFAIFRPDWDARRSEILRIAAGERMCPTQEYRQEGL